MKPINQIPQSLLIPCTMALKYLVTMEYVTMIMNQPIYFLTHTWSSLSASLWSYLANDLCSYGYIDDPYIARNDKWDCWQTPKCSRQNHTGLVDTSSIPNSLSSVRMQVRIWNSIPWVLGTLPQPLGLRLAQWHCGPCKDKNNGFPSHLLWTWSPADPKAAQYKPSFKTSVTCLSRINTYDVIFSYPLFLTLLNSCHFP